MPETLATKVVGSGLVSRYKSYESAFIVAAQDRVVLTATFVDPFAGEAIVVQDGTAVGAADTETSSMCKENISSESWCLKAMYI